MSVLGGGIIQRAQYYCYPSASNDADRDALWIPGTTPDSIIDIPGIVLARHYIWRHCSLDDFHYSVPPEPYGIFINGTIWTEDLAVDVLLAERKLGVPFINEITDVLKVWYKHGNDQMRKREYRGIWFGSPWACSSRLAGDTILDDGKVEYTKLHFQVSMDPADSEGPARFIVDEPYGGTLP